jgi:hypothetical protein
VKQCIVISILLAALLPSSGLGDSLYQWKKIDKHMIDLINEGYEITNFANTFSMMGKGIQLETYILKKNKSVCKCYDNYFYGQNGENVVGCKELVSPNKK